MSTPVKSSPFRWTLHGDGKNISAGTVVGPRRAADLAADHRHRCPARGGHVRRHLPGPALTGFPPATTLLFSGVGTLLFLIITAGPGAQLPGLQLRVHRPDHARRRHQHGMGGALGGVIVAGAALFLVGADRAEVRHAAGSTC